MDINGRLFGVFGLNTSRFLLADATRNCTRACPVSDTTLVRIQSSIGDKGLFLRAHAHTQNDTNMDGVTGVDWFVGWT